MTNFWEDLYSNRANVMQSKFGHLSDRQKIAKIFFHRKVQHVKDLPTSGFIPALKNCVISPEVSLGPKSLVGGNFKLISSSTFFLLRRLNIYL